MKFGTGQSVRRREDPRLLTGRGAYLDDVATPDALCAMFVRSPVAHATITECDAAAARAAPGVVDVILGPELEAAGANDASAVLVNNRDGEPCVRPQRPLLAVDRVRYVGEPVALIVARSRGEARDAVELLAVDYDELPAVVDTAAATEAGDTPIHDHAPDNVAYDWVFGDEATVRGQLAAAAHRVELEFVNHRLAGCPLEPRGATASWDATADRMQVAVSGQNVWRVRDEVALRLGLAAEQVHVTIGDVGGGFGTKAPMYPEYTAIAYAAKKLGGTVRWYADRSESFLSDVQGRDHVGRAVAGFDADYRLLAVHVESAVAMGAYLSPHGTIIPSELMVKVLPGAYDFEHLYYAARGVYTNTTPTDAYRGAGRPEAMFVIEQLMDRAARQFGLSPLELRRRNFVPPQRFPYRLASGETVDTGDFARVLDRAAAEADVAGFADRRAESAARGRLRGLGVAYYLEIILGNPSEDAALQLAADGMWELLVGTQANGQGHETAYTQILHECTGLSPEKIRIVQGDSARIPQGGGTGGSRSVTVQGVAIQQAAQHLIQQLQPLAEDALEVAAVDLEFVDGAFRIVGSDRVVSIEELGATALAAGDVTACMAAASITLPARSFPNGCHICELEIDPETGAAKVVRYVAVDDFGTLINPLLVAGQVHGGVVQGLGQVLLEGMVFDEGGQPVTASFMDYALPRADDVPAIEFHSEPVPSTANAIGMKGCGEAGTVGALPAAVNAAVDALWSAGVRQVEFPLRPTTVWRLLQDAG